MKGIKIVIFLCIHIAYLAFLYLYLTDNVDLAFCVWAFGLSMMSCIAILNKKDVGYQILTIIACTLFIGTKAITFIPQFSDTIPMLSFISTFAFMLILTSSFHEQIFKFEKTVKAFVAENF